ncbi:MAG: hypothetical protein QXJ64_08855 [Thermosphaera sp.]
MPAPSMPALMVDPEPSSIRPVVISPPEMTVAVLSALAGGPPVT